MSKNNNDWFTKLFINEAKPAMNRHSGSGPSEETKTYILVDENGTEIPAVLVDEEVIFTATANDIREGAVAATGDGVTVGTKVIPSYNTTEAVMVVQPGKEMIIKTSDPDMYDYTELQVIVCKFNTNTSNSTASELVVINGKVYRMNDTEPVSSVIKNASDKTIDLGITNENDKPVLLRYFTYKEIY